MEMWGGRHTGQKQYLPWGSLSSHQEKTLITDLHSRKKKNKKTLPMPAKEREERRAQNKMRK